MYSLSSISIGVYVTFVIMLFITLTYTYRKEKQLAEFDEIDLNGDGIITRQELKHHLTKELEKRSNQPPKMEGLAKSATSGIIRGFLMGLLINGFEGAVLGAFVLGTINPIISSVEYAI